MGFDFKWVGWIIMCVKLVSYLVLVYSELVGPIILRRGLCQEDPLSPYLFILCSKGLTTLIMSSRDGLHGVSICRGAPNVSYLFYADDYFLFFRASRGEVEVMKGILNTKEAFG